MWIESLCSQFIDILFPESTSDHIFGFPLFLGSIVSRNSIDDSLFLHI